MQQKQTKSSTTAKTTSSFSKMMLQRDKNRLKEQQKHAYIELLKAPRGKKYLQLLAKTTELCQELAEIEEEIKRLELEVEQGAETLPASDAFAEDEEGVFETPDDFEEESGGETEEIETPQTVEPEIKVRWKQPLNTSTSSETAQKNEPQFAWKTTKTTQEAPVEQEAQVTQRSQVAWKNAKIDASAVRKSYQEKQQRLLEMKQRQAAMVEEFQAAMREFEAQLPAPDRLIGLLWPELNTDILMRYGVISCPGTAWSSPEELVEQMQPRSEQEERQWLKGGRAYESHICEELLLVEVYMDVICIVYKDGNTKVIE